MNNAHVIKWCRWKWWLASRLNKQFAQLHWATQERIERAAHDSRHYRKYLKRAMDGEPMLQLRSRYSKSFGRKKDDRIVLPGANK